MWTLAIKLLDVFYMSSFVCLIMNKLFLIQNISLNILN